MGFKVLEFKIPVHCNDADIQEHIRLLLGTQEFSWQIIGKSLDARKKSNIFWLMRVLVSSPHLKGGEPPQRDQLKIPYANRGKKVLVVGSGPAGFFSAFVLQKAGFQTIMVDRGSEVKKRARGIHLFEKTGRFNPQSNYAFGEGGAGTFSDGKLTSRSKHISREREFILSTYIQAGAPSEIAYLAHPHVGTDFLKKVVENLRKKYLEAGGEIHFETQIKQLEGHNGHILEAVSDNKVFTADYFVFAPGHSSYETFRMMINSGVGFRIKNFALGSRAEHPQSLINHAQWGVERLDGLKAAEYRLSSSGDGRHSVYSFCMCPGGMVVPATSYAHTNIVNGMSYFRRAGEYANAACVVGVNPLHLTGRSLTASECLDWLESLEHRFFEYTAGYKAPFCSINDFMHERITEEIPSSSYPLGLKPAPLWTLLPPLVSASMREGLKDFSRKIKGYEKGILLGLESKTSSPIQVDRAENGLCHGFDNLFMVGEGSGYAGGIVSSAADGIRMAMNLVNAHS